MTIDEITEDAEGRMKKALERLKKDLGGIRTGAANPGLVDTLKVDVYGSPTPLKQIASVSCPEPQQIVIRPFDPSVIKDIEKCIIASDLGLAPQNDGKLVRLNVPSLSTEVRKSMVTRIKELSEESKIAFRNIRRDANKTADQGEKDKTMSEDDRDIVKKEVQELIKKYEKNVADLSKAKGKEVLGD